jgi:hypothetical protein
MNKKVVAIGVVVGIAGLIWLSNWDKANQKKKLDKLYKEGVYCVQLSGHSYMDACLVVEQMMDDSCEDGDNVDLATFRQKIEDFSSYH